MAYSSLPYWPLFLFGVLEPAALFAALHAVYTDAHEYFVKQDHTATKLTTLFSTQAAVMTYQTANVYVLLALLAIICCWTKHTDIPKYYLGVVALADLGHIYSFYLALGEKKFMDYGNWNDMVAAGVGFSAFLCINRLSTIAGLFGRIGVPTVDRSRKMM